MTSAVLPNRNETGWGGYASNYAKTIASTNPYRRYNTTRNPNSNPNRHGRIAHVQRQPPAQPETTALAAISDQPKELYDGGYVTFNISAYTPLELKDLKNRLIRELEEVRTLRARLETPSFYSTNPKPQNRKKKGPKRKNPYPNTSGPKRQLNVGVPSIMRKCSQILAKIMKHKYAWVFNKPVDAASERLFDYHVIIKNPMDLGTVKLNLDKGFYNSPLDFAADVRLVFDNAMIYNHKEHDVHKMAVHLLEMFNGMFEPANNRFRVEQSMILARNQSAAVELPAAPTALVKEELPPQQVLVERNGVLAEEQLHQQVPVERNGKLVKPKARDPNKREMTFDEKANLGMELAELPQEKTSELLQILKRRNSSLVQEGDEIVLDMGAIDNETLWELDMLVNNYKKAISEIKQQQQHLPVEDQVIAPPMKQLPVKEIVDEEQKVGDEDVDIGEEMPVGNYPSVEIEKDVNVCVGGKSSCSSSSSSSGSGSTSDSDSGSSSGSDSDAGCVHSPHEEANQVEKP